MVEVNQSFKKALDIASKVMDAKNPLPILDYFIVKDNSITVSNLESVITVKYEGDSFEACLPISLVKKGMAHVKGVMQVEIGVLKATFKEWGYEFEVPVGNVEDFPLTPIVEGTVNYVRGVNIDEAARFVVENTLSPILGGVYFNSEDGHLTMVGATHESIYISSFPELEFNQDFVIPIKACRLLSGILEFDVSSDDKKIKFEYPNVTLISRKVEGNYPAYRTVIPKNDNELNVTYELLIGAIEKVKGFADANTSLIKLDILPNKVVVTGQDSFNNVSAKEELGLYNPSVPICIGFNSVYLLDALKIGKGTLKYSSPKAGVYIENEGKTILVMPMSILNA